jgi:hypothetical protein
LTSPVFPLSEVACRESEVSSRPALEHLSSSSKFQYSLCTDRMAAPRRFCKERHGTCGINIRLKDVRVYLTLLVATLCKSFRALALFLPASSVPGVRLSETQDRHLTYLIWLNAAASRRNSLTTAAKASGLTPFSQRAIRIARLFLSSPQSSNFEISNATVGMEKVERYGVR